jgi:hypothetical protein
MAYQANESVRRSLGHLSGELEVIFDERRLEGISEAADR